MSAWRSLYLSLIVVSLGCLRRLQVHHVPAARVGLFALDQVVIDGGRRRAQRIFRAAAHCGLWLRSSAGEVVRAILWRRLARCVCVCLCEYCIGLARRVLRALFVFRVPLISRVHAPV